MATLVLSTVGTLVGGPIGGAVGALVGRAADAELLKPRGRQGPRLGDLKIQTSAYGNPIPAIYGRMRVAGTVIWATDLREEATRTGGGKGRPSATNYSYSASFAVLLSARPIRSVGRIWADGNLMRGAAGDWKVATRFRLHAGGEDQPVDPLIAAAEGVQLAPAYRGMAYALFEDLDLGPYGNRIPALTFEVEADEGAAEIAAIVSDASGGAIRAGAGTGGGLVGFATGRDTVRGLVETITDAAGARFRNGGDMLHMTGGGEPVRRIADAELCGEAEDGETLLSRMATPASVEIVYHDPARDGQIGLQRARSGGPGRREERFELPAAIDAATAKAMAETRLDRAARERRRRVVTLPWRHASIRPGDEIAFGEDRTRWRVAGWELVEMRLRLRLVASGIAAAPDLPHADAGRPVRQDDQRHGETVLAVMELPPDDAGAARPILSVAAAGTASGWRGAALLMSLDGGARFEPAGRTAAPAVMGQAEGVLADAGCHLIDMRSSLVVRLLHGGMMLEDADAAGLAGGRNLAMVGEELLQFGQADPLGADRWRLSRLLRGRRGTERFTADHAAGEGFVLVEPQSLAAIEIASDRLGAVPLLLAAGIGDGDGNGNGGVTSPGAPIGRSLVPPSPVHLRLERGAGGRIDIGWIRRSRSGWRWVDGADAGLGEARERYRLEIGWADGTTRVIETDVPRASLAPDEQGPWPGTAMLMQIGDHGLSPATRFTINPAGGTP